MAIRKALRSRGFDRTYPRLRIEPLEDRTLPAIITVTSAADGPVADDVLVTLREAILSTNGNADTGDDVKANRVGNYATGGSADTIIFAIAGGGVQTIMPTSALPEIVDSLVIDGTTQFGWSVGGPVIELTGTFAGESDGLVLVAPSTVRGLVINNFSFDGIFLKGTVGQSVIEGNYIGTDVTGTLARGNNDGISIRSPANVIGGTTLAARNVISGNGRDGVSIGGLNAVGNVVLGNYIGTNVTGTLDLGNARNGVLISEPVESPLGTDPASFTTVGGDTAAARNLISGNDFNGVEIGFGATANRVVGNFIGTTASGLTALGNSNYGVGVYDSTLNTIGDLTSNPGSNAGNVISGNEEGGVFLGRGKLNRETTVNTVQGNLVGVGVDGVTPLANEGHGVLIENVESNVIGGTADGARNIISANKQDGVLILAATASASSNRIQGNYIGTNKDGQFGAGLGNGGKGVEISNTSSVESVLASNNLVGGPDSADGTEDGIVKAGNVISGNLVGVLVHGKRATGNFVQGNYIGTNSAGDAAVGNRESGVEVIAPDNLIGGTVSGAGNLVSGNSQAGIYVRGDDARGNRIQGNLIGTDHTGAGPLGNLTHGVLFELANDNVLGGTEPGAANTIAFNGVSLGGHGVVVTSGTGNAIRRNSIFGNKGRGIDLVNPVKPDTFTLNDAKGDPDDGPNGMQDYPVIMFVTPQGAVNKVTWTLNSTPNTAFAIEFFANSAPDPSGFGEGHRFLDTTTAITDTQGDATFVTFFPVADRFISATATDPAGNTSEFSMVDTDGDALADAWETHGIDVDEDGVVDLTLDGANPERKDLYVEVDAMAFVAPTQADLDRVAASFANAPVVNPNGSTGITLHAKLDEILPLVPWTYDFDDDGVDALGGDRNANGKLDAGEFWDPDDPSKPAPGDPDEQYGSVYFHSTKNGHLGAGGFGTSAQRSIATTLAAKRLAFRYAIFADRFAVPGETGGANVTTSGIAELPGNDFIVTLGAWRINGPDEKAGTFMHELGHTLGLRHGGADNVHFKPNYHSVMNYIWQTPEFSWMLKDPNNNPVPYPGPWELDYSERAFNTLDERNNLDESAGIGGHVGHWAAAGPPAGGRNVWESGPVNWNADSDTTDTGVRADVNRDGQFSELLGHEDWSNLQFYFLESPDFVQGVSQMEDSDEMSLDLFDQLNTQGDGPGILHARLSEKRVYEDVGVVTVTVVRSGGTLGTITVDFATADGTATAGADYAPTSGTLTFGDGEYRKTFDVVILNDSLDEQTESIRFLLSNPTGGAILPPDSAQTLELLNGNAPVPPPFRGSLGIEVNPINVNEDAGLVTVAVTRSGSTRGAITVNYATADITATSGADYVAASGTLTFADGEERKTFTVQISNDTTGEYKESIRLILSNPTTGATLGTNAVATLSILDDDARVFVVTNVGNAGAGSLRQAILDANSHPGLDFIRFNIGAGVQTISLLSSLTITDTVDIDGTTQPGFGGRPIIELDGSKRPFSGFAGLAITASNTVIRGLVINRFVGPGIQILTGNQFSAPTSVVIEGNFIGTDVTGMQVRGNGSGVLINDGNNHRIGGSTLAARNVISGNVGIGIQVGASSGFPTQGHVIQGNYIGVAADGVSPLGNGLSGVEVGFSARSVTIGDLEPSAGNVIAFNQYGIKGAGTILSNSIHSNLHLGITLGASSQGWARINHADFRSDPGLNYPVLASALSVNGQITISGYLNSRADETFVLQFFSNRTVELSGFGEGETLLGSATVVTDAVGHADFTFTFAAAVPDRRLITATSTRVLGGTSEFSRRLAVGDVLGSIYTVNTTNDVDDGVADAVHTSLREAILAANNHPGLDVIRFSIGSGVKTIAPLTIPLPALTDPVVIDGTTQPEFAGTPIIELIGTGLDSNHPSAQTNERLTALRVFANDSIVRGLVINRFEGTVPSTFTPIGTLWVTGHRNVIEGNFVGTDVTGTRALPNSRGVRVAGSNTRVGGTTSLARNVFSGNRTFGLFVGSSSFFGELLSVENVIQGNFIGTDITGTKPLGNGFPPDGFQADPVGGLITSGSNYIIGGAASGAGNVISANRGVGVSLGNSDVVQGNLIGTDVTGTVALGNTGIGISGGFSCLIGGNGPGEGNLVSNNRIGISPGQYATIQGNLIGTDITGTRDFGNKEDGIFEVVGALIGGTQPGAGNLISGNDRSGIFTNGYANTIQGNLIGVQADGTSPLANGSDGIAIGVGSNSTARFDNLIGGLASGAGNIIASNGGHGVNIASTRGNAVLCNSIFSNGKLAIDLGGDGPTPNDPGDDDTGSNDLQNLPVLTRVVSDGTRTLVEGTLNSAADAAFLLQFFASSQADPSGFGEGSTFLASGSVTTDASGNVSFALILEAAVPAGQFVTATATDSVKNTSEFSRAVVVVSGDIEGNRPPTADPGGPYGIDEGSSVSLDAPASSDPDGDLLSYSWDVNGDGVFGDAIGVTPTLSWEQLQALGIVDGPSSFPVRVRVNDGHDHEVTSDPTILTVLNVAPTSDAGPDQTVHEGDLVTLNGAIIDPGTMDAHTLRWRVAADNGQVIADGTEQTFSFVPRDNGRYAVTFTVTDDDGGSGSDTVLVTVNNVAPKLSDGAVTPVIAEGGAVTLSGTINDPGTADTFTLLVAWGDGNTSTYHYAGGTNSFQESYLYFDDDPTGTPADDYVIDFTVIDDDTGASTAGATVRVNNVSPEIVSLSSGATDCGCASEGGLVTLNAAFADAGVRDSHTATINWGDGTTTFESIGASGGSGLVQAGHHYTQGGIYAITLALADDDAGVSSRTTQALVVGATVRDGVLQVVGTEDDDHVTINVPSNGWYRVHANFFSGDPFRDFPAADVRQISVVLCDGDDRAQIADSVLVPARLDGGPGDDALNGGGGDDLLLGGEGADVLQGGGNSGRDLLIGGRGADRLVGNAGDDILVAGTSAFDNNVAALDAIMAEWTSDRTYAERVANLRGTGSGPRSNGEFFLIAPQSGRTVFDDGAADELTGSADQDWFFANLDGTGLDVLLDHKSNEELVDDIA